MPLLFRGSRFIYQAYQGRFLLLAVKKDRIVIKLLPLNRSVPVGDCETLEDGKVAPFEFVAAVVLMLDLSTDATERSVLHCPVLGSWSGF
jgi:hypothetical protein